MNSALPSVTTLLAAELDRLIASQSFDIHFQPIVDVQRAQILGYEALTRAPANSALHSPLVLFEVAASLGRLIELERLIVRRIMRRFVELHLPGQIFLNVTADTLMAAEHRGALISEEFRSYELEASRVVVELTETRPILDLVALGNSVETLRSLGFRIALDDLGEGFSSLKRWVDLRPDFVKIDRHFVDGVATDPLKQQFVRSILEMAATSSAAVIAEGLEQEGDLQVLRSLGIDLCQGYLFARPSLAPRTSLRADLDALLTVAVGSNAPQGREAEAALTSAAQLARKGPTVDRSVNCATVIDMFRRDEHLYSLPVLDTDERPLGILRSMSVLKRGAERFFMEIFGRKSCVELMDVNPLVFDASANLRCMSEAVANIDDRYMVDGFVITEHGRYLGVGRTSDLLKVVSDRQLRIATNANPLTLLPGNAAIDRKLDRLLNRAEDFVMAYWDINHFKPFNDTYGYRAGDDLIKFVAELLTDVAAIDGNFVGHIGGDDFVMLLTQPAWQDRLQEVCRRFDTEIAQLLRPEHLQDRGYAGKDRQGHPVFHLLPTLSAGVLRIEPGQFASARQVSLAMTDPRQQAKLLCKASGYFVERRKSTALAPSQ
ncbi:bifunctional diguanylate cyclase/phosphodiesterase [Paucibacter sp. M5-1]|uniref:bifunctional diguanylate cyclase/phosphodiesterase n=1 Tax=Paucibacter sp. M5-1 TaxID=3015998 RepID=UPI0022B8E139|nr:bifunctional diguanylate cyclase/phosphodiesterase [Paucibacter sp. M5-1]MCZ7880501.1 EAL and GGDEF domain-containing protein [Paucibacter sp. M5-1]